MQVLSTGMIVEAVVENPKVKAAVLSEVEGLVGEEYRFLHQTPQRFRLTC